MEKVIEEKKDNIEQTKTESLATVPTPNVSNSTFPEIKEEVPPINSSIPEENIEEPKNASEILDDEEKELPEPQSSEVIFKSNKPKSLSKPKTKKCPKGCIKKSRCKGPIRGGKRSIKISIKSSKNKSKKNKKAKKSKK